MLTAIVHSGSNELRKACETFSAAKQFFKDFHGRPHESYVLDSQNSAVWELLPTGELEIGRVQYLPGKGITR